jgi:pilus assembly protein FimV
MCRGLTCVWRIAAIVLGELMNKNAVRLLLAGALLSPASLFALGLGEIRLNSALNQPFDADIEIASATNDELTSLKVTLAGDDLFRRYGLDRPAFLSGFSLRLEGANSGRPVIKVRSANAVSEPFLNLLVEVSWTGGRVLREYTVLLDPPIYSPTQPIDQATLTPRGQAQQASPAAGAIERPAPATPAAPATVPPPAASPSATPAPSPAPRAVQSTAPSSSPQVSYAAGDSYTVKPADTLSKIANKLQIGANVARSQTIVALYRANAQAFGGNMNVLRAGSVLRIPATVDIEAISTAEANAEISRQYGAWRNGAAKQAAAVPQGERLRLVPAEQTALAAAAASSKAAASSAASAASVAAAQKKAAEEAEARRLLDLKNAELAQLQKRLNQSSSAASKANASSAAPSTAAPASASASASAPAATEPVPAVEPTSAEPQQAQSSSAATKPIPAKPVEEPSLFDSLAQYWLYIVAAGLAVFVGLMIYFRRRQQVGAESESAIATMTARDFESQLSGGRSRARGFADADDSDVEVATDERGQPTFAAVPATTRREPPTVARISEDTLSSETAIHVDQQDALAEADFHMAYGLYDQAADIVKLAIDRQPERRDLALKLAEIYFVWGNKDLFLETAKRLHDTVDEAPAGEWDKIAIMGKQICPGEALFAGNIGRSFASESVDVNLEGGEHHVDIDLFEAPEGDQPKSDVDFELANTGAHSIQGDSGLDFLLDEPQRGVDDEPTREMDTNARTQETPTIESPYLADLPDEGSQTIREQFDTGAFSNDERNADQTSEIALDEIGLNVDELETTGTVENSFGETTIGDDELTRLAKRTDFSSYDRTVEAPHGEETKTMLAPHMEFDDNFDSEDKESNTITVEQVDFDAVTGEHQMEDVSATGMFKPTQKIDIDLDRFDLNTEDTVEQRRPSDTGLFRATQKIDVDLDHLADPSFGLHEGETVKQPGRTQTPADRFSDEVFNLDDEIEQTAINNDLTSLRDNEATLYSETEAMSASLDLPEMEPVTMSEVGTKLDLARAYMDMGDPDGARSILQEVLDEGNGGQKQEAQRLLDSIG